MKSVRVFVSSPSDVEHERLRVERVAERLNGELHHIARFDVYRWDKGQYYTAASTFQAQIPETPSFEIVIGILGHKLGSDMPRDWPKMADGKPYPSGTAYELLTAIEASVSHQVPDVYIFKKQSGPALPDNEDDEREVLQQWERLKTFWREFIYSRQEGFKAGFEGYSHVDELDKKLEGLLRQWLERKGDLGRAVAWPIEIKGSPFRGLAAFGTKHAPVFFGRSRDITKAVDALKDVAERRHPFLLVIGPSGSGKSSVARAGLSPRLTTPGVVATVDRWREAVMRPGEQIADPLLSLATHLFDGPKDIPPEEEGRSPALPELAMSPHKSPDMLARALGAGDVSAVVWALDKIADDVCKQEGYDRTVETDLLLVVDQLDELFAADVSDAQREAFAKAIAALVATGRVWIIATLRADLYERFLKQPELFALKTKGATYDLAPPGGVELGEIIRGPAVAAGLIYDTRAETGETLDERLLGDVDRPDMLPLLQFTLDFLFEQRETQHGNTRLTFAAYDALGGLSGAIDREAERAVSGLGKDEQERLPRLLRQLAAPAPETGVVTKGTLTVRSVPVTEAAYDASAERLVRALIDARILLSEGSEQNATIRLAHQRVIESWKRAKDIAAANAEFYRIRDDVEDQLNRWQNSGKRRDLLIPRGLPLVEAESIAKKYPGELPMPTLSFIAASGKRARLRQRLGAMALVAVFGIGVATAGELKKQADQATQLAAQLTGQNDRLENQLRAAQQLAQQQFSQEAANRLLNSVYLIVRDQGGTPVPQATAFAFSSNKLGTNAHVTEAIKRLEAEYSLIAPDGSVIKIKSVESHPGYLAFKQYRSTIGLTQSGAFKPLDLINEYDVGIIEIDPSTPLPPEPGARSPAMLELASTDDLNGLGAGFPVASAGFPMEGMVGLTILASSPVAILQFGYVSRLLDVFMSRASRSRQTLMVHSVPVVGGSGGSPLIGPNGKVVGIVSGGTSTSVVDEIDITDEATTAGKTERVRIPSAAQVNFAQRADLLAYLIEGRATAALVEERAYWREVTDKRFRRYFDVVRSELFGIVNGRYLNASMESKEIGGGTLEPRKAGTFSFASTAYSFVLEPGHVYGFIADSKTGAFVGLNVKKKDSAEFLKDEKDERQAPPEPGPAASTLVSVQETTPVDINVFGLISQPADYVLYAYTWDETSSPGAPDASGASTPSQQ